MSFGVFGDATVDIKIEIPKNLEFGKDQVEIISIKEEVAGDAGIVVQQLSVLGNEVSFYGKIGNDLYGRYVYESLLKKNIDVKNLKIDNGETGINAVLKYPNLTQATLSQLGLHTKTKVNKHTLISYLSHLISYIPAFPCYFPLIKKFKSLKKNYNLSNKYIATDLGAPKNAQEALDKIKLIENGVNICSMSGIQFSEEERNYLQKEIISSSVQIKLITLSEKGVVLIDKDKPKTIPAFTVNPIDTYGIGNAFMAGFLTALAKDINLINCVVFGQAVAAAKVRRKSFYPKIEDVFEIIENSNISYRTIRSLKSNLRG